MLDKGKRKSFKNIYFVKYFLSLQEPRQFNKIEGNIK